MQGNTKNVLHAEEGQYFVPDFNFFLLLTLNNDSALSENFFVVSAKVTSQRSKEEQKRLAEQKMKEKEAEEVAENAGQTIFL